MTISILVQTLITRLQNQEDFISAGGRKTYDLCADGGYNEAVKNEIEFLNGLLDKVESEDFTVDRHVIFGFPTRK